MKEFDLKIDNNNVVTIDGVVINQDIFDEEKIDYKVVTREEMVDDLIRWISECGDERKSDKIMMKDDLEYLMSLEDEYIFSSISTNDYIAQSDEPKEFYETCKELLELNGTPFVEEETPLYEVYIAFSGRNIYRVDAFDFADASKIFCDVRDKGGFGASDMLENCGNIYKDGDIVGQVCYNGKVINKEGKLLYNPYDEKQPKCLYCKDSEQHKNLHFACEICGDGMCDECYDMNVEHDLHYNEPYGVEASEFEKNLLLDVCSNDDPSYLCEKCAGKLMTDYKIAYIKKDVKKLVGTRWKDKAELEKHLKESYDLEGSLADVDESGLVSDYAFIMSILKDYGYIDIYYLKVPYGENTIYITEVSVSEE